MSVLTKEKQFKIELNNVVNSQNGSIARAIIKEDKGLFKKVQSEFEALLGSNFSNNNIDIRSHPKI